MSHQSQGQQERPDTSVVEQVYRQVKPGGGGVSLSLSLTVSALREPQTTARKGHQSSALFYLLHFKTRFSRAFSLFVTHLRFRLDLNMIVAEEKDRPGELCSHTAAPLNWTLFVQSSSSPV